MDYSAVHSSMSYPSVAEPRARYRGRAVRPRVAHRAVDPLRRAQQRVRERNGGASWQQILALSGKLAAEQTREGREIWLALEELLHGYWLDLAAEHYNLGYDAGKAQAWLESTLRDHALPREKLTALTAALVEVVAQLDKEHSGP
jgi:hypothetical protein